MDNPQMNEISKKTKKWEMEGGCISSRGGGFIEKAIFGALGGY